MILRTRGSDCAPAGDDDEEVDVGAIKAAAAASAASYRSFADATRSVLDLLERLMPDCALYLAHLDRAHAVHRIVDTRGGAALGLRSNLATPLGESLRPRDGRGARAALCNDVSATRLRRARMQRRAGAGSYLGVPLELSDGAARRRAGRPLHHAAARSSPTTSSCSRCSRACSPTSSSASPTSATCERLNDSLRDHARGMGAIGRVVRVLAGGEDARRAVCRAACEMAGAPVAFLLEPSGREFVSTAMSGVEMAPVTIQPRPETSGRAFTARESYFVADARQHPALAAAARRGDRPRARRCSSRCCATAQVAGVLIVIWQLPLESAARGRRPACCGCSPPRPRWRSSTRACAPAWRRSR